MTCNISMIVSLITLRLILVCINKIRLLQHRERIKQKLTHAFMHVCMYVRTNLCRYICMYSCMRVCMCVSACVCAPVPCTGPGFGPKPSPARGLGRAGPLQICAGRAWAYILRARAGPGMKNINHIGLGPGLSLV